MILNLDSVGKKIGKFYLRDVIENGKPHRHSIPRIASKKTFGIFACENCGKINMISETEIKNFDFDACDNCEKF